MVPEKIISFAGLLAFIIKLSKFLLSERGKHYFFSFFAANKEAKPQLN